MKKANHITFAILYFFVIALFLISCNSSAKSEEQLKHEQDSIAKFQSDSAAQAELEAKMRQATEDSAKAAQQKASH